MSDLLQRLLHGFSAHARHTGIQMTRDNFEVHVHPIDWMDFLRETDALRFRIGESDLVGLPVVQNVDVAVGYPEIRSTWRYVL